MLAYGADMRLLRGRGSSIGPMVPFRPLTEALMSLLRGGEPVDVAELGPYLPVLARLIPDLGPPSADEDGGSLVVIAEAVLRLAGLVGRAHGCLLVLDDLQRRRRGDPGRARLPGQQPRPAADAAARHGQDRHRARRLTSSGRPRSVTAVSSSNCGGWPPPTCAGWPASCLGVPGGAVPDEVADHVRTASGGVPLLAEEMLNSMVSGGQLVRATASGGRSAARCGSGPPSP